MTTNTIEIALCNGIIKADYKTKMIDLKSIESLAMAMAGVKEVTNFSKRLSVWKNNQDTIDFLSCLSLKQNSALENLYKESGRGRHSKCWGSIFVALKYAMYVNKEIEIEVLKTFIESRILDYRLFGVEQFKNLNIQLDKKLDAKLEDYKAVSLAINIKCNGEYIEGWNHSEANPDIQKLRNDILDKTAFAVEMQLIKTVEQLIDVINNYNI